MKNEHCVVVVVGGDVLLVSDVELVAYTSRGTELDYGCVLYNFRRLLWQLKRRGWKLIS